MPLPTSPLPRLMFEEGSQKQFSREHRRKSSEFGWFDIEPLLTSRTETSNISGFWDHVEGGKGEDRDGDVGNELANSLPRALERVFCWLEEVEAGQPKADCADEAIINTGALVALRAPSSPSRRDGDKVVASKAVTKTDFCLSSRDQPSTAIGIYAHRVVCRSKWLFWSESFAEYLVIIGTETELLRGWRSYIEFSSLAHTARQLGARGAVELWERLNNALGYQRRTDPSSLQAEARWLGRFLTTLMEELDHSDVGVLADFVREPTTYVVVGVEDVPRGTATDDACTRVAEDHDEAPVITSTIARASDEEADPGQIENSPRRRSSCSSQGSSGEAGFGAAVRHPMKWEKTESLLTPAPRIWVGL